MEKKKENKKGMSTGAVLGIGAGVAALAAASYVLFGKDGKKNRKAIKGWAVKMKGEIIEKLEEAKEITEPVYHNIVDGVKAKYAKLKNIDQKDVDDVTKEIKKHWVLMVKDSKPKKKAKTKK
jgi:hypothetical protein